MRRFHDLPINSKLSLIILATIGAVLLVAFVAFLARERQIQQEAEAAELTTMARVLAVGLAAEPLADRQRVEKRLASGVGDERPISAVVLRGSEVVASHLGDPAHTGTVPRDLAAGSQRTGGYLIVAEPVPVAAGPPATVYLKTRPAWTAFLERPSVQAAGGLLLLAVLASVLLFSLIERVVVRPIVKLSQTAKRVSMKNDFSIRAETDRGDEVGSLYDAFNDMLARLERRDGELRAATQDVRRSNEKLAEYSRSLEQRVAERTAELARATAEAEAARDRAMAASRAKSTFLANMSHELRTPLNAIIGYSEILAEDAEDTEQEELLPDLERIRGAGQHLLAIINDVLDLSKIEAGKMEVYLETFDVPAMVSEVAATVRPLIEQNDNRFEVRCRDDLGTIRCDLTKLRQTLFNLLSNAGKFTEGGQVRLDVARRGGEEGETMLFRVSDTGIGISETQLGRLFQEFTQADDSTTRKFGGTGLGLALSQRLCKMLGGEITVASRSGEGSVFTVRLPTRSDEEPAEPAITGAIPQVAGPEDGTLVLAIDDDPTAWDLMTRNLSKEGFRVVCAGSGEEGLRLARELRPDVITLDVMMPTVDGWGVLSELKSTADLSSIPVILVTMVEDKKMGLALGATDYMTKPVDWKRLTRMLDRHRSGREVRRVLVVDDDARSRRLFRRVLEKEGFAVDVARDGREALDRLAARPPDLILLDLMMPEMDGFEVLDRIKLNPDWSGLPIIVVTAKDLTAAERERVDRHVEKVLEKGAYGRKDLLGQLRKLVTKRLPSEVL